jgi:hypothetical protein
MLAARQLIPYVYDLVASAASGVLFEHGGLRLAEREAAGSPAPAAAGHVVAVVYEAGALVAVAAPGGFDGIIAGDLAGHGVAFSGYVVG